MPAARENLLDAAFAALADRPWADVRMVDVAAAAGVSRQTLYNEFGSKEGLGHALVRRAAEAYLAGAEEALTGPPAAGPGERLAGAALWTVRAAAADPLVRAALTGFWGGHLPPPGPCGDLLGRVRERAVRLLADDWPGDTAGALARACDTATRLALSYVVAPAAAEDVTALVRQALRPAC
ncbi:TetR/AcrR family transcriptional regulator [Streptomyces sp. B1866]|uniref:TetR/AcrR family transcriptional regulator n=1 Tax=Streptomyces sp. B1866 TaxID=3075431 RepID=UPI00288DB076|nr:TetR/AcrR family transcriptional regulator [Streptomyces sp. B1866]MDT3396361.1 TetR/AcrR family transcriptional regulator [Streptomyces sp. B1866]